MVLSLAGCGCLGFIIKKYTKNPITCILKNIHNIRNHELDTMVGEIREKTEPKTI